MNPAVEHLETTPQAPDTTGPEEAPTVEHHRGRTALRWVSALALCAAVAAGTAYATTLPARNTMPGLGTPDDGRYVFPALAKPTLPYGSVPPGSMTVDRRHPADVRKLLLPAPAGAVPDPALPGTGGWLPTADYARLFLSSEKETGHLNDRGVRHIAATGWRMKDGARTEIYLVQFDTETLAAAYVSGEHSNTPMRLGVPGTGRGPSEADDTTASDTSPIAAQTVSLRINDLRGLQSTTTDRSGLLTRAAFLRHGDTVALIVRRAPEQTPVKPFEQTVVLQAQLLS